MGSSLRDTIHSDKQNDVGPEHWRICVGGRGLVEQSKPNRAGRAGSEARGHHHCLPPCRICPHLCYDVDADLQVLEKKENEAQGYRKRLPLDTACRDVS